MSLSQPTNPPLSPADGEGFPSHGMDILNAYWRMGYITSPTKEGQGHENPFVYLPKMGDDRVALIVHRGRLGYPVLNRFPYNPGHLLAIPYREIPGLEDLTEDESADMMRLITEGKRALTALMKPDGFNIGFNLGSAAGAGIPKHLHCHIVPRWNGDTNFMPVVAQTRVLPQALETTWEQLHRFFTSST